jgi:hypothetical protein
LFLLRKPKEALLSAAITGNTGYITFIYFDSNHGNKILLFMSVLIVFEIECEHCPVARIIVFVIIICRLSGLESTFAKLQFPFLRLFEKLGMCDLY